MQSDPTVFVVDDDSAMCESLAHLIASVGVPVETFSCGQAFLDSYDPARPGCMVLDVRMPGMSGLELQEKLAARESGIPIIILTGQGDVPMATQAIKAGAIDFLEKPCQPRMLLDRIHQAIERDTLMRRERAKRREQEKRLGSLSPREREVMELLVEGKTVKAVALELGLSHKTVQIHRARILEKTQSESVPHLIWLVVETGTSRQ